MVGESHQSACPEFPVSRRFLLRRDRDVSGVSGTGYVAEGVQFRNGRCVLSWMRAAESMSVFASLDDLIAVHGHDGATQVEWVDG